MQGYIDVCSRTEIAGWAIAEGGAYLNNSKVTADDAAPAAADLLHGRYLILRVGKRTVGGIEVVPG